MSITIFRFEKVKMENRNGLLISISRYVAQPPPHAPTHNNTQQHTTTHNKTHQHTTTHNNTFTYLEDSLL
jgi:hypothetical protein